MLIYNNITSWYKYYDFTYYSCISSIKDARHFCSKSIIPRVFRPVGSVVLIILVVRFERVVRGTSARLLLDLPHAQYHNHLINLLLLFLLLRILAHGCVCVFGDARAWLLDFPHPASLPSTDFFISSSRSARTNFTTSLSFLPLRACGRVIARVIIGSSSTPRVINDPTCSISYKLIVYFVLSLLDNWYEAKDLLKFTLICIFWHILLDITKETW